MAYTAGWKRSRTAKRMRTRRRQQRLMNTLGAELRSGNGSLDRRIAAIVLSQREVAEVCSHAIWLVRKRGNGHNVRGQFSWEVASTERS